ncbi:Coatomer subunit delta [Hibiscus syriacus]|uniref:Coatomer subunit delta n=1 Tax=Hibiscus syriacus TaxID=106335 RepID=A0A6A2XAH4_HIBSY|nr:Coatomer subunit delta [Hibiscus syriacus]
MHLLEVTAIFILENGQNCKQGTKPNIAKEFVCVIKEEELVDRFECGSEVLFEQLLLSRQFVDMTRIRIEANGSSLSASCNNKQSNVLEDLETLRLLSRLVTEYSYSPDEEGIGKSAFELVFAFDEVICLGHKENVTVAQVKQYCEMESHEEKLHKLVLQSKINETKDVMKRKASEIDKSKIDKNRGDKGGFMSMGSGRIETGFTELSISSSGSGFGGGTGFGGPTTALDAFSTKPKGRQLSSATAPPKGFGMQLGKSQKTNQFLDSLKAEGELIVDDVQTKVGPSRVAAAPLTDPVTLTVEEKLNVILKRDGGISNFAVEGTFSLQILNQEDGIIQVQIETGGNPGILFKTHPNMNKELFSNENILGLKDPNRPFPTGLGGGEGGIGLLMWRMQSADESMVPLTINCWPSVSGNETYVSIEYEASTMYDLQNVVISVPLPDLREAPNVRHIDGEWRNSVLEWSILLIDNSNRSGPMEFVVPPADSSAFFPISVGFLATSTYIDLKVVNIIPLRGGAAPKFSQRTRL